MYRRRYPNSSAVARRLLDIELEYILRLNRLQRHAAKAGDYGRDELSPRLDFAGPDAQQVLPDDVRSRESAAASIFRDRMKSSSRVIPV